MNPHEIAVEIGKHAFVAAAAGPAHSKRNRRESTWFDGAVGLREAHGVLHHSLGFS